MIDKNKILEKVKNVDTSKFINKVKKQKNESDESCNLSTEDNVSDVEISSENKENSEQNTDKKLNEEQVMNLLDSIYGKCLNGVPKVSDSVDKMAEDYLSKYDTKEKACKAMLKNQIIKCTTSGFITGFGGIITMPVTLPANVGSVLYVQMRMIACVAYMAGFELDSDQTQTFVYACLAGVAVTDIIKQAGIKFGVKFANGLVKKIPGKVLTKINQKVGFRFVTKFGSKGVVNLGKMVPGVGAVIGGGLDLVETKTIANRSYRWFFEGDFSEKDTDKSNDNNEDIIDVEDTDKSGEVID